MARAEKFVPLEKRSPKERKAYYAKQRGSWNGVNPVTRVVPDKTKYNRKRADVRKYDPDYLPIFMLSTYFENFYFLGGMPQRFLRNLAVEG